MDEGKQIEALVAKMPTQSAEQFQSFFLQLQLLVSTAAKVRVSLEHGRVPDVEAALNEADSTGISQYLLRMAVVQGGAEVAHQKLDYNMWCKDMDAKTSKIIR